MDVPWKGGGGREPTKQGENQVRVGPRANQRGRGPPCTSATCDVGSQSRAKPTAPPKGASPSDRTANLNRRLELEQVGLRAEDVARGVAQVANLALEQLDLLSRPAVPNL